MLAEFLFEIVKHASLLCLKQVVTIGKNYK